MSQENVEIVRRAFAYEIHGVGDRAVAEEIFHPDVVLNPVDEGPFRGRDAMRDDIERWASVFEDLRVTVEEIIDAGIKSSWSRITRDAAEGAASRSIRASTRSIRCTRARSRALMSSTRGQKPSKPPGWRSST